MAEGQRTRLGIKLTALRQIGFTLTEIVNLEQIRGALA